VPNGTLCRQKRILAIDVASPAEFCTKSWVLPEHAKQPRNDDAIEGPVETPRAKATTDPGYLELDMWFDGPHQEAIAGREAAKHRKAKRKAKDPRKPAEIELRPAASSTPTGTSSTGAQPDRRGWLHG
jgi:hypothetical protein